MAREYLLRREKSVHEPESTPESEASPEVLDVDHLGRYTMGDRELERELLRLFRSQLRTQVAGVAQARDAESWRFATHTLKGVARSIGARAIADTAEKLEQLGHDGDRGDYARLMSDLAAQIAACEDEIGRIVGQ